MNSCRRGRVSTRTTDERYTRRQAVARGAGFAAGGLIASSLPASTIAQTPTTRVIADDFTGSVDIGGRLVYVETAGTGGPTVVFEAGGSARSDVWSRDLQQPEGERTMVFPGVAAFAHACTHDRPGTIGEVNPDLEPFGPLFHPSRSEPVPMPRTIMDIADELEMVLRNSGQTGPYVLVGHSMGGLVVRYYAMTRPGDVVGLVLVDATPEDVWDKFRAVLPPDDWTLFEEMTVNRAELRAAYPEAESVWTAPLADDLNVAEVRRARMDTPLEQMPVVVLSHGIPFEAPIDGWPIDEMEQVMAGLQAWLAGLVPGSRHIIAEESGHNIHQDQPDLVIEAVRMVVDAVRDPSTWTP